MPLPYYTCSHCGTLKFGFFPYSRHLKQYHESEAGFQISCSFDGCKASYTKVRSYVKHVSRKHKSYLSADSTNNIEMHEDVDESYVTEVNDTQGHNADESTTQHSENAQEHGYHMDTDEDTASSRENCSVIEQLIGNIQNHCVSFVLSLREKHMIPSVVQEEVVSSMKHLLSSTLTDYRDVIHTQLSQDNVTMSEELRSSLDITRHCESLTKNVESEYALLRYLKETNKIVLPQTLVIDESKPKQSFQYVSIIDVLKSILSHDDIVDHFTSRKQRSDSIMEDFCDGSLFKSDTFFLENLSALSIHLYSDEFEVCNPIGAKKGKHKIVAFYYTVGNFHPKYRSQMRWIFLALLVRQQYLNDSSYHAVLQPVIRDLRYLEETGVTVLTNVGIQTFKAKLVSLSADNLSAHVIGGFQQHFHAGRICRTCLADHSEISEKFSESDVTLRTKAIHSYHLEAVAANPQNARVYGVKGTCAFSDGLQDFDVTQRLPHDSMHDLLEGILPLVTRLILAHYIRSSQLEQVNALLFEQNLTCGCNRPNTLTASSLTSHISGTAVQKLELFLLLPRLLSSLVDLTIEDPVWRMYLCLRDICDVVFAPAVDSKMLTDLEFLTSCFLELFVEQFGKNHVIPKHHYLLHYANHLRMFGPLRNMQCLRFEAKHRYFKNIAVSSKSFKNVTKTLAKRHQIRQSWELSSSTVLDRRSDVKRAKTVSFQSLPTEVKDSLRSFLSFDIHGDERLSVVSAFSHDVCYKVDSVYVVCVLETERVPVLLLVKKIVCIRNVWLLCGALLVPEAFHAVYHAYAVRTDCDWLVFKPEQLVDHTRHDLFMIDEQQYVSLRYGVCG